MSKPVFDDVLRLHGRRDRLSYVLITLACWAIFLTVTFLLILIGASASETMGTAVAVLWLIGLLPLAWTRLAVSAQRCRDLGWSGWLAALVLVPYLGLLFSVVLFLARGELGPNRYGPDPIEPGAGRLARLHPA